MSALGLLLVSVLTATSVLASPSAAPQVARRDPAWTSQGCYTDSPGSRTLKGRLLVLEDSMTVGACTSYCHGQGFNIAGVEYGKECYCDYALQSPSAPAPAAECNIPCSGDAEEFCGAGNRISIYKTDAPGPSAPPVISSWEYQGCYTDSVSSRSLSRQFTISGGVSNPKCIDVCKTNGFSYAGTEYSNECFCGKTLTASKRPDSECTMTCQADRSQFCGGPNRLTVYSTDGATPPVTPPCEGKPFNLCCMNVAPWSTNSGVWGGICGYTPPSSSQLVGARCITRPTTGCPSGTRPTCCAGTWPGQCALGTNCIP